MLSAGCKSPHLSISHCTCSPDSLMSCNWPWKSLIISHYSLIGIIWSSPSFLLLKIEWTRIELFNAHCNMFPFCHSFTSFIHSLHSFIQHGFTECLFCARDSAEHLGHRDGQDRVPSSPVSSHFPELTLFIRLPTTGWALHPTNKGAFIPIPGVTPLPICQLSLDLLQITPSLKGCLVQQKGWQSWDKLGDVG